MTRMGEVLAGLHSAWEFDTDALLIRFERGLRTPRLFQVLGERHIPYEALRSLEVSPGRKRGTVVLRAFPRQGADPLIEAADGQLRESWDPYRLVLPADRKSLAEGCARELRATLGPSAEEPADRHLVDAPTAPLRFKGYDGKASFDGTTVFLRWSRTGASSTKWKAGDQSFPVEELAGVEWRSPETAAGRGRGPGANGPGHLRLLRRGAPADGHGQPPPDQDPATVVFGLGHGVVHESLPLAAAVLQAVRAAEPAAVSTAARNVPFPRMANTVPTGRADPADIAERIRHLGELHEAGLLTDEEFTSKKNELLTEL